MQGQINMESRLSRYFSYTLALDALPHLEHRIRYGKLTTSKGQPIPDLYAFIRAVEEGEF